jgi:hypothetical protein
MKIDDKPVHILVATPCYGNVLNTNYALSCFELKDICYSLGIRVSIRLIGNESLITRGRNYYVNLFLTNKEYTHLLFIDADIGFYAKNIIEMLSFNNDIVCIPYPKKSINWTKLIKYANVEGMNPQKLEAISQEYVVNFLKNDSKVVKGFIECSYGGTGCMMIKRNVIETMIERFHFTKYTNDVGGYNQNEINKENFYALFDCFICPKSNRYLSEDYAFCERATESGFRIWAYLNGPITHHGGHCFLGHFGSSLMMTVQEQEEEVKREKERVESIQKVNMNQEESKRKKLFKNTF